MTIKKSDKPKFKNVKLDYEFWEILRQAAMDNSRPDRIVSFQTLLSRAVEIGIPFMKKNGEI